MRRAYFVASFILVCLCLPATALAVRGSLAQLGVPVRITQDPGADVDPTLAVAADGRVYLAWKRHPADRDLTQVLLAQIPDGAPVTAASVPLKPEQVGLALVASNQVHLAWSQQATVTHAISLYTLGSKAAPRPWEQPVRERSAFAVDNRGRLHESWVQGNTINYANSTRDLTVTLALTTPTTVAEISLALDAQAMPHMAWTDRDPLGHEMGLYYAPLISGTTPIRVAAEGRAAQLMAAPSGGMHLVWLGAKSLNYASSRTHWVAREVLTDVLQSLVFAAAVGPGDVAHLVWTSDKAVWYANSTDWLGTRRQVASATGISRLCLALDPKGRVHIAWAASDEKGNADLYYLAPESEPQLRIAYPLGGEMLTRDVLAQAETNLLPEDFLRVEFYVQRAGAEQDPEEGALLSLGLDQDGRDGWSVPLHIADLSSDTRYRIVALGTDVRGNVTRAVGEWFTVQPQDVPWVWVQPPDLDSSRAQAYISVLTDTSGTLVQRMDLYLAPVGYDDVGSMPDVSASPVPTSSLYIGSYDQRAEQESGGMLWQRLAYDSRRVPDGRYRAVVVATDRLGRRGYGVSAVPFVIDNSIFPRVEITAPVAGSVVRQMLQVEARASDLDGTVQHVDFYLERTHPLVCTPYRDHDCALDMPEMVWLGNDSDGSDGWSVRVPVDASLDGDNWYVRAVAFDDQGLSASVRSNGPVIIIGRDRPYLRFLDPKLDSIVRGSVPVTLSVETGFPYLSGARLYAEDPDGSWALIGPMTATAGYVTCAWDTTAFSDGTYALVAIIDQADGHKSLVRCDGLSVDNVQASLSFRVLGAQDVLTGTTLIRLQSALHAPPARDVQLYYRDEGGQLRHIGQALPSPDSWMLDWNTTAVLDGRYDLIASILDAQGHQTRLTRAVWVRNTPLSIAFTNGPDGAMLRGARAISWRIERRALTPISVTAAYSPDAGAHWSEVATNITSTDSFLWHTDAFPDSAHALLRLTVSDGLHRGQAISGAFSVNNVNAPPHVTLLAPRAESTYGRQMRVAWQAYDSDGDALMVDLDYRRGTGDWVSLARHMSNEGFYTWDIKALPPAKDYELRITAVDPAGATGTDAVQKINVVDNSPPVVRLLWPNGDARLMREAAILWQATDAEQEGLLIDLYYSDNAGQTWLPLAEGVPNTGYYVWQVSYLPRGNQYRVRVVARDAYFRASAESSRVFVVGSNAPPQADLLAPIPGSTATGLQLVRWSTSDPDRAALKVQLALRAVGKTEWQALANDRPDDGFYLWDTRAYPDGDYELRLIATDDQSVATATLAGSVSVVNRGKLAPRVMLHAPRGGERWAGIHELAWSAWDHHGDVLTATLYTSLDGGARWDALTTLDARAGYYLWDTREAQPGRACLARVVVSDSTTTTEDTSAGALRLTNQQSYPPTVRFISPDSSGKLLRNNTLSWSAEDPQGHSLDVSLALSEDDGLTWHIIAGDVLATGDYLLDASALASDTVYHARLDASDGVQTVQVFSAPFKVAGVKDSVPDLEIRAPSGGERWSGKQDVRWRTSDVLSQTVRVDIDLSADGGQNWSNLVKGLRNTGSYTLDTTGLVNGVYFLRMVADNGQSRIMRVGEPLTVDNPGKNAPVISIIYPRAGDVWSGTREVRWRAFDPDGSVLSISLAYSVDLGATWRGLASGVANTGGYVWDTTTVPNCNQVWLRATASDGKFVSSSLGDGAIAVRNAHVPLVALLVPRGGEYWAGEQRIAWFTAQRSPRPIKVALEVSFDMAHTWQRLAADRPAQGSYLWDTTLLPENSRAWLRVVASDGLRTTLDMTPQPVILWGNPAPLDLAAYLP